MTNWLAQVGSVTLFNLLSVPQRKGSAVAAAVGIAGVVMVFVGVLSIAEGFRAAMSAQGSEDVAIVLRSSADNEMTSGLSRQETRLVGDAPGIARDADGPLVSSELFVMINLPKRSTGSDANVPLRGVERAGPAIRGDIQLVEGRMFESGRNELVVGAGAARAFAGLEVGRTLRIGQNTWTVVGRFTGGGGSAESELWTDAAVLQPAYNRGEFFQSVYARVEGPEGYRRFKDALTASPRLRVKILRQSDYLADQSVMLGTFITGFGTFTAAMMALGALFGTLNTMYSAVAARTREIATLRALGFGAGPIILSVLIESLALALIGGSAGALLAYLLFNGYQAATINWQTFSQIAFAFRVTPALLGLAILWAVAIGLLGGLFPAIRAARLPIASALRET